MHIYIMIRIHMHMYVDMYITTCIFIYIYIYICIYIHERVHQYMHMYTYVHIGAYVYVCIYVCMIFPIFICILKNALWIFTSDAAASRTSDVLCSRASRLTCSASELYMSRAHLRVSFMHAFVTSWLSLRAVHAKASTASTIQDGKHFSALIPFRVVSPKRVLAQLGNSECSFMRCALNCTMHANKSTGTYIRMPDAAQIWLCSAQPAPKE